jgi:hypothetical protein
MVRELPELVHVVLVSIASDAQARREHPEVPPAPGEHARPYGVSRGKETEDVLKDTVWQGLYAAVTALNWCFPAPFPSSPRRHSIGQAAGVGAVGRDIKLRGMDGYVSIWRPQRSQVTTSPRRLQPGENEAEAVVALCNFCWGNFACSLLRD